MCYVTYLTKFKKTIDMKLRKINLKKILGI